MGSTATMTLRLPAEVKRRLEKLAKATDRSKAYLASRAIENYLEVQEWQVRAIEEAVREADSDKATFFEHAKVEARVKKLATGAQKKGTR
jgi:RHH-type rel operon transcriptional repressor/antitoxin RelB